MEVYSPKDRKLYFICEEHARNNEQFFGKILRKNFTWLIGDHIAIFTLNFQILATTRSDKLGDKEALMAVDFFDRYIFGLNAKLAACLAALLPGIGCYICILYSFIVQSERISNYTTDGCPQIRK